MNQISDLHPRLQEKISALKSACNAKGLYIGISECLRTKAEQDALYAKGRTSPGNIVTNAKGSTYSSQHQWGIAFDFYRNDGTGAYNESGNFFENVGAIAKSIGLGWGGDWTSFKDRPHLYLPDWGSTTTKLKQMYSTPEKFMSTWGNTNSNASFETSTTAASVSNQLVKTGQAHVNNFVQYGLSLDGICGQNTKKAGIKVLQHAMNLDYGNTITEDGIWGSKSRAKLGTHYVKQGEKQYMVTAAEILMYLNGIDPNGVECPGTYGNGLTKAAKQKFGTAGTKIIAQNFLTLIK